MSLDSIRDQCTDEAAAHRDALPQRFLELHAFVRQTSSTPAALAQAFTASLGGGAAAVPDQATGVNPAVVALLGRAEAELAASGTAFGALETWLMLCVPMVEDGNNFGVGIVLEAAKRIKEARAEVVALQKELPEYHKERGAAMEKVTGSTTNSTTTTQTTGDDTTVKGASEEERSSKQANSSVAETKVVAARALPDFVSHLVTVDVVWHMRLTAILERLCTLNLAVADFLDKNDEKIQRPKGTGGGMSMF